MSLRLQLRRQSRPPSNQIRLQQPLPPRIMEPQQRLLRLVRRRMRSKHQPRRHSQHLLRQHLRPNPSPNRKPPLPRNPNFTQNHQHHRDHPIHNLQFKKAQTSPIRLSNLNLSGSVPEFLSELQDLTFIDLSFNQLTGPLPRYVNKLRSLLGLSLNRNQLTGFIPDTYGKFTGNVPQIILSHNQLSGELPSSLSLLNFSKIDISRNKLNGDVSMLFGKSKSLFWLDISRNAFAFDFGKVELPAGLGILYMNHNGIYGNIPSAMSSLKLQFLNVSYNRLCGRIPVGGELERFDNSSYVHNKCLCGSPLPECK
ncbi:unnamed protein product [Rhodiola kirilowii]